MTYPVSQKPRVAIGFVNLICYRIFIEKCNKFISAGGNKRPDDFAIPDRRNSGKAKRAAAAEQKHQHQLGIVIAMMTYRNFMISVPAADAIKKIIPDLSGNGFERKFPACRIVSDMDGFAVVRKVQARGQFGDKVRVPVRFSPPQAMIQVGDSNLQFPFGGQLNQNVQQGNGIGSAGHALPERCRLC